MEIPVFVSCPTNLSPDQENARSVVLRQLRRYKLTPRSLGRSDYPTELPLREVLVIARHCAGGVILGFEQFRSMDGISKPGTAEEKRLRSATPFPTPWNNLEAGILFGLGIPLLFFETPAYREEYLTPVSPTFLFTQCQQAEAATALMRFS
jgi:hypothetical protein